MSPSTEPNDSRQSRTSLANRIESLVIPKSGSTNRNSEMRSIMGPSTLRMMSSNARPLYPQPSIERPPTPLASYGGLSRRQSRSGSPNSAPSSDENAPERDRMTAAIREAMEDDLWDDPSYRQGASRGRLSTARVPRPFMSQPLRPPPLFDLARQTTLSSSSFLTLDNLPPLPSDPASDNIIYPITSNSTVLRRQSPPTRTSLDTLRSIQAREMHTSATNNMETGRPSTWWFQNKEDVDPLLEDRDKTDASGRAEDKIRRRYRAPKEAVVLAHGLLGFDSVSVATIGISYWRGIREALEAAGCEVLIAKVPATSSIEDRAKVLEATIAEVLPGRKVHLIGHSMGGLDCRYLVSHLRSDRFTPISITTVATPHRGSSFADYFIATVGRERMPSFLSFLDMLPNGGGDGKAFDSLTVDAMRRFNEETPDAPDVHYFSWGASFTPGLIDAFKWPHGVILEKEGANDGLVSVESSKWGTYLGTLEGVNHLDLVGWINTARYAWADLTGKSINFKPATFYLEVVDNLAGKVEGQLEIGASSLNTGSSCGDDTSTPGGSIDDCKPPTDAS